MGNTLKTIGNSDFPESDLPPSFDPHYGFSNPRKQRVMIATKQELMAANVPLRYRDYCAHKYLDYKACERIHFPFVNKCKSEHADFAHCMHNDYVLRMKEYERERRLLRRQKKKEAAMNASLTG